MPKRDQTALKKACDILGMSKEDLELALDMLVALKQKMDEWERTNGLRKKK